MPLTYQSFSVDFVLICVLTHSDRALKSFYWFFSLGLQGSTILHWSMISSLYVAYLELFLQRYCAPSWSPESHALIFHLRLEQKKFWTSPKTAIKIMYWDNKVEVKYICKEWKGNELIARQHLLWSHTAFYQFHGATNIVKQVPVSIKRSAESGNKKFLHNKICSRATKHTISPGSNKM